MKKKRKKKSAATFRQWLKTLPNTVIWKLANEWRKDLKRTKAIQSEYNMRLKKEALRA